MLSAGLLFSDRIEALLDGRVSPVGASLAIRCVEAQALFRSVLREAAWDVAELSMGSWIAAVAAGKRVYLGLPVFPRARSGTPTSTSAPTASARRRSSPAKRSA